MSQDNGATWGQSWYVFNAWDRFGLVEDASGKLVLLVSGGSIGEPGLLTLTSADGRTFSNQRRVTPTAVNYRVGSILQARDGSYYVSYSNDAAFGVNQDVFMTRSLDLSTWESPVRISSSAGRDNTSAMVQTADGRFYLAYVSSNDDLTEKFIAVASSADGRTWGQPVSVPQTKVSKLNLGATSMVEVAGKPVLFYGLSGFRGSQPTYELYSSVGGASGWSAPQWIAQNTWDAATVVFRDVATIGVAYIGNDVQPSDVFFTNLERFDVTGTTPAPTISSPPAVTPPVSTVSPTPTPTATPWPTPTFQVPAPDTWAAQEKTLVTKIDNKLTQRLKGRIVLQVEERGEAWYINPTTEEKYYLRDGAVAYAALRKFGLGIRDADLAKIPVGLEVRFADTDADGDGLADKLEEGLQTDPANPDSDGDGNPDGVEVRNGYNPLGPGKLTVDLKLVGRLQGRILLQVESRGEAWYLNPADGKRYYLKDGDAAYQIMRFLSLGITNGNLRKISVGEL